MLFSGIPFLNSIPKREPIITVITLTATPDITTSKKLWKYCTTKTHTSQCNFKFTKKPYIL